MNKLTCIGCGKIPEDIEIYVEYSQNSGYTSASQYVWNEEGTLNRETDHFWCDDCYIKEGMPLGKAP